MLNIQDPEIADILQKEADRQEQHIELIASENYTSLEVMKTQGSVLTNKYAEGYSGKRYYGGCDFVDEAEDLAIARLKKLYNCGYANVQPHSGSQANAAVYLALLKPGDTVLSMSLSDGGHLTHGSKVNFSGALYNFVHYGLDIKTGLVDYSNVEELAQKYKPKLIVAGFSAYSRILDWEIFSRIAKSVNAKLFVDMAHVAGLVATGHYPNPIPHSDVVTSTTHKTLRGPRGGIILSDDKDLMKKINTAVFPGTQGGPLMHVIAAKAVAFKEAMTKDFKLYIEKVVNNSRAMANVFINRGFSVVSGGTDNHMFLVDLRNKGITGKDASAVLEESFITVNKNTVPGETTSPFVTSGIRIGTPAITSRGFDLHDSEELANWMCDILEDADNKASIKNKVVQICKKRQVYQKD